jgi:hypothetical protein
MLRLPTMNSAPQVKEHVLVTVKLPRRCAEWLDLQAVRRKHATGAGNKASKAPIMEELIDKAMREEGE